MQKRPEHIEDSSAYVVRHRAANDQINEQETKSALVSPMLRALGRDCEDRKQARNREIATPRKGGLVDTGNPGLHSPRHYRRQGQFRGPST